MVAYTGPLAFRAGAKVRYGFNGWVGEKLESPAEPHSPGIALATLEGLNGRSAVDLVIGAGHDWDNNHGTDYRLWTDLNPVDSHLHAASRETDRLGLGALNVGLGSAGISRGIISWRDNQAVDSLVGGDARFSRLVWVDPGQSSPKEVADRLAAEHVGLKLHPGVDDYPADDPRLDSFVEQAARANTPVAVHSGPGNSDPAKIARLAARFPTVPFVLYHTYLGLPRGRRKAIRLARDQENLILETSWCSWDAVEQLIGALGPERVIFGSDASVDGERHYSIRNLGGRETYKEVMCWMVERLGIETARAVLGDNTRRLFRLESPDTKGDG